MMLLLLVINLVLSPGVGICQSLQRKPQLVNYLQSVMVKLLLDY